MGLINYKKNTHREVFGKTVTIEDIIKTGCTFYLFDKREFVYVGRGVAYNPTAGEVPVTQLFDQIRNVRRNDLIVAKRKGIGRKLVAVKYVRKLKVKNVKKEMEQVK